MKKILLMCGAALAGLCGAAAAGEFGLDGVKVSNLPATAVALPTPGVVKFGAAYGPISYVDLAYLSGVDNKISSEAYKLAKSDGVSDAAFFTPKMFVAYYWRAMGMFCMVTDSDAPGSAAYETAMVIAQKHYYVYAAAENLAGQDAAEFRRLIYPGLEAIRKATSVATYQELYDNLAALDAAALLPK